MAGIFAKDAGIWNYWQVTFQLRDKLMGGVPKDPKIIEGWLKTKGIFTNDEDIKHELVQTMRELGLEATPDMSTEELFATSLTETKIDLPLVPGVGLYLNRVFFENYRRKFESDHDSLDFGDDATQRSVQLFKWEHIIRPAIEIELRERPFFTWLQVMGKYPLSYEMMTLERFAEKRKALYIMRRDDKDIALTRDA